MNTITKVLIGLFFTISAYSSSAAPISEADIVIVNGTEWAQVDLFTNTSWSQINALCPGGVCGEGTLNGYDMAGWIWASTDEVNAMFNVYLSAGGVPDEDLLGTPSSYHGSY